ncbi:uncharacterized protein LOC127095166 [Lathyrus oleraceus]|uniref:uncharacterized protein LOC127095166 n=1 Tax=Pisum sativum TaxID=3888 RepID=UPI0021D284EC|nr:uncharacterized protein LOC127095166 [Pisum sativum]
MGEGCLQFSRATKDNGAVSTVTIFYKPSEGRGRGAVSAPTTSNTPVTIPAPVTIRAPLTIVASGRGQVENSRAVPWRYDNAYRRDRRAGNQTRPAVQAPVTISAPFEIGFVGCLFTSIGCISNNISYFSYIRSSGIKIGSLNESPCLKLVNHNRKILDLENSVADWFGDVICYSGLVGLCVVSYMTINHGMQTSFAERWHSHTSSFHLHIGKMAITLDDISCLLHLPIRGKLLGHERLGREEVIEIMVTHLRVDPTEASNEVANTIDAHARFKLLEQLYKDHMQWDEYDDGDNMQV